MYYCNISTVYNVGTHTKQAAGYNLDLTGIACLGQQV